MIINSALLKEAIADAKAVRATALANARATLGEAFAPRFEAMFADKLKEEAGEEQEEEQEEGMMQEVEAPNQVDASGGEAKGPKTKPVTKGQPGKKKSGTDFKPVQAGVGPKGVGKLNQPVMENAYEEEQEEGKKVEEAGLTSEDLNEIIAELENEITEEKGSQMEVADSNENEPNENPEGEEHEHDHGVEGDSMGQEPSQDISVETEPGSEVDIDTDVPEDGEMEPESGEGHEELPPESMNAGGLEHEPESKEMTGHKPEEEENINLEELLAALNEEAEEDEEEEDKKEMDEITNNGLPTNVDGQDKAGGVKGYAKGVSNKWIEAGGKNHNISGKGNIGSGTSNGKPMAESVRYKVALREAYQTIEYLRGQINEVNLLNAKLLYTNRLFKDFSGILDDTYRMKIIESFDLTKSVREVKLAYALLAESLNFGKQQNKVKIVANKPSISKGQVKQITEGFASKPVSSTRPSQLISEGTDVMALRFKKLAGIKDAPKSSEKK